MTHPGVEFIELADVEAKRSRSGVLYEEFLRVASMSAGIYVLGIGAVDGQLPHRQDEMYYVVNGRARMRAGTDDRMVRRGSVIFVAADVEHRFYDIEEELTVLVLFAPAENP